VAVEPKAEFAPLFEMIDAGNVDPNKVRGGVSMLLPGEDNRGSTHPATLST
jgi:hypothetical protein